MLRIIFCLILSYTVNNTFSQKVFIVDGTLIGRDTGSIILSYPNENNRFINDTAKVNGGSFLFTGKMNQPTFCWVSAHGPGNRTSLFIEPKRQKLILKEGHFSEKKLSGSFTQSQEDTLEYTAEKIQKKYANWTNKFRDVLKEMNNTDDSITKIQLQNKLDTLSEKMIAMNKERLDSTISFIISHNRSYASATNLYGVLINRNPSNIISTDSVNYLFNNLSLNIRSSIAGRFIQKEIDKRKEESIAPDFNAVDANKNAISLHEFKGKYVLLNFWASWCEPCIKKLPELKKLLSLYHKRGFEIINISVDIKQKNWEEAIKKYQLNNFINVINNTDIDSKYPFTREPIPSEMLLNPEGKVIWNSLNRNQYSVADILERQLINHN